MTAVPRWTPARRAVYLLCCRIVRFLLGLLYRHRTLHADRVPRSGPVLLLSNHQSYLDPPVLGSRLPRRINFVARAGLFRVPGLAWLITALGATPVRDDAPDTRAMRTVLALLQNGCAVALFPEGTRSPDGRVHPFKRGLVSIVRRARCPVVLVAVEGCYDAWPRSRSLPRLRGPRVMSMVDPPLDPEELLADGPDAALERLRRRVDEMRLELRRRIRESTAGRYPPPGPPDSLSSPPEASSAGDAAS